MFPYIFEGIPVRMRSGSSNFKGDRNYRVTFSNGIELETVMNFSEIDKYLPQKVLNELAGMCGYQIRYKLLLRLTESSQIAEVLETEQLRIGIPLP